MKANLRVEHMEERRLLSASVTLSTAGVLTIVADDTGDNIIVQQVQTPTNPNTVEVLVNSEGGKTYDFDPTTMPVTSISFQGGLGNDYFANKTSINSTQQAGGGAGVTYLQGGSGKDTL